ncbi:hypothetical protein U7230_09315 [Carboxydochorda subterranea]|uniref:HepT-like domain-containing protein n=1 Tax=Carboxydichorda subterranea TaxID=3109565 RepID=A0ABZ1BU28_9FIRM|nr:hypothetical protein [Limnochorda sp. L945t]WRP16299.1 hypothetical protein U7230_09315 [Limnochorda sp. L945t]
MIGRYAVLAERIRQELEELAPLVGRARRYVAVAVSSSDPEPYLDGAALNLHGFYSGLERVFEAIAREVDGSVPAGPHWHRELLRQMQLAVRGVRPAVLTGETAAALEEYLGFRHVVRALYTTRLRPDRIRELADAAQGAFERASGELLAFAAFLETAAADQASSGDNAGR